MKTFCAVNDAVLIDLVASAKQRIVFVAPGLTAVVADALGRRFAEIDGLDITVVLDADEDVCRIGYGEVKALERLHALAQKKGFWLKSQPGLRVGVLLADEQTLVWSPTPRSVEAPPEFSSQFAPNGLLLGRSPGEQLAHAIAAEGTNTGPRDAEIGRSAITPEQVQETVEAHRRNPPIPVDLARVTRVFSSKLQFIELKVTRAKLSLSKLSVPNQLLNADVTGELEGLIESSLHAFASLREERITVPAFVSGMAALGTDGKPLQESVSESSLERQRRDLEKRYVIDVSGFGRLIERDQKSEFERRLEAYKTQLMAHSEGIRKLLERQAQQILDGAVSLIMQRSERASASTDGAAATLDADAIRAQLFKGLERAKGEAPTVSLVFKDVTYEQTPEPGVPRQGKESFARAGAQATGRVERKVRCSQAPH